VTYAALIEARDRDRLFIDEQAALRRVATLVAAGAPAAGLFAAVADEVARVLDVPTVMLARFEADRTMTVLASLNEPSFPVGSRWPLDGPSVSARVFDTGRPARIDDYSKLPGTMAAGVRDSEVRSIVGVPIIVDRRVWGVTTVGTLQSELMPADTVARLSDFTELAGIAISNAESRDRLGRLVNEQAALRRVATLVAEGATAEELFSGVAREVAEVLDVSAALLDRYEPDGTAITLAASHDPDWTAVDNIRHVASLRPLQPGGLDAIIYETGHAARIDDYSALTGELGEIADSAGIGSGCAAPIFVGGNLWGTIRVFSRRGSPPLPADAEARVHGFTELVATAVSNAAARADLIASRARIVAAGDEARQRIERNLHDGTQQRLIALGLDLQRIRETYLADEPDVCAGLVRMEADLQSVLEELRELSRGLHPPLLTRRGLLPSLRALARRSPIPIHIDVELKERPPPAIETALYYLVSEALTNAIKHSQASEISVSVETDHAGVPFGIGLDGRRGVVTLHAAIADDGVGAAEPSVGSGLAGLTDRIDALGGRLTLDSPSGHGTRISVVLPLGPPASA